MALIYNKVKFALYYEALVLTNYHVNPFRLAQDRSVLDNIFIRREQDLELINPEVGLKNPALRWIALVSDYIYCRGPLSKLPRPVSHCRQWDNN